MSILDTKNLTKIYGRGETAVTALFEVSLRIQPGEFIAVMGPSGCGKSTLLNLIGGLDMPTSGEVFLEGERINGLGDDELTRLRRRRIGFVFQFFNLIPVLQASENAAIPLLLDGMNPREARQRALKWLNRVGLEDRLHHRPDQLSGGQQQLVAIARALVTEPVLILADEPTGNLDSRAAGEIARIFLRASKEWGRTVILVTHDPHISAFADRIIFLKDGRIVNDARMSETNGAQVQHMQEE
ncbi:MAG: ABC transporter ATP-binding protein [Proteobacteria bacterium]|nr:ABC transporter ATP-binding protein [Pseudomonadota bacterium]